jgi:hypothetical protein
MESSGKEGFGAQRIFQESQKIDLHKDLDISITNTDEGSDSYFHDQVDDYTANIFPKG